MPHEQRRILIAVDGSDQSFETVRYLGHLLPRDRTQVTLFHVVNWIPDPFWDLELDPGIRHRVLTFRSWKSRHEAIIRNFMERADRFLHQAGYPPHPAPEGGRPPTHRECPR